MKSLSGCGSCSGPRACGCVCLCGDSVRAAGCELEEFEDGTRLLLLQLSSQLSVGEPANRLIPLSTRGALILSITAYTYFICERIYNNFLAHLYVTGPNNGLSLEQKCWAYRANAC